MEKVLIFLFSIYYIGLIKKNEFFPWEGNLVGKESFGYDPTTVRIMKMILF